MKTLKKLLIGAAGASLLIAPAAFAAPFHGYDHGYDHGRQGPPARVVTQTRTVQYGHWQRGQRFDHRQARSYRVISNPRGYHLRDAPRGYRWVQSDRDAVLVGVTSGLIASVIANAFN